MRRYKKKIKKSYIIKKNLLNLLKTEKEKSEDYCNNVTRSEEFPKRKSRDNNHPDFTLVGLTSTTTPH